MLRKIQSASEKTQATDSVRWYTIPTDTAMPKADVTYNTIGFEGNAGSGATFTLYLDNAKTGSKTYHVYFKQLAGSGKLTLTTGKAGATNLVLSVGTYVVIIYVDENGNITTQGATATDVIQTGSTQPAQSGAVADEISNLTDIASSLPTDAVLHYSFDEVPDYPDGTADYRPDFNTSDGGWVSDSYATVSHSNGVLNWKHGTSTSEWRSLQNMSTTIRGKIAMLEVKPNFTVADGLYQFLFASYDGSIYSIILGGYSVKLKPNQWNKLIGIIPNSFAGTLRLQSYPSYASTASFDIRNFYIGDGSYSTPIIDNTNGQWNSISQSGVAVQGVSGKGLKCFNGNQVNFGAFNLNNNFSVSLWVKPDSSSNSMLGDIVYKTNQFFIRNGASSGNNYIYTGVYNKNTSDWKYAITSSLLVANKYTHIVCTRNGTELKLYLDGVVVKTTTLDFTDINNNQNNMVVSCSANTRPQSFDDLLIFDRALSETEVLALYQNKANTPKYYTMSDYKLKEVKDNAQAQTLATPITIAGQSYTTVESALQALAGAV